MVSRRTVQRMVISVALFFVVCQVPTLSRSQILVSTSLDIVGRTDKSSYYIREQVKMSGSLNQGGQPATGYLLAVQVNNRKGYPLLFRTIQVGDVQERWPIEVGSISVSTDPELVLTDTLALNSMASLSVTIRNTESTSHTVVVTATVFDGNLVPIFAQTAPPKEITPDKPEKTFSWSMWVPGWAHSGKAFAAIGVYTDYPQNWESEAGLQRVLAPEAQYSFYIARNLQSGHPYSVLPTANASGPGWYEIYFRMPPDSLTLSGSYSAYIVAYDTSIYHLNAATSVQFNLADYPTAPNAAFTYMPLQAYENMTVLLDGSSSSAEGYNTTIVKYEWTIYDPNSPGQVHIVNTGDFMHPPPANATHVFPQAGTYTVQLNVTDNRGMWSSIYKPVVILSEFGPTANFSWAPQLAGRNQTITFDASQSLPGWSKQTGRYSPVAFYTWDFGDSTIQTTSNSSIQHMFTQQGNYSVRLTATDSVGRFNNTVQTVQVLSRVGYDLNSDRKVDMKDIAIVARAFGATPDSPNWNPIADINIDSKIDMKDVSVIARHFGEEYP